jgi:hypothetical protein
MPGIDQMLRQYASEISPATSEKDHKAVSVSVSVSVLPDAIQDRH